MNDIPYTEVREEAELHVVRLLLHNGWFILDIYHRKRELHNSHPMEFEEYPVYILGNPQGG